MRPGTRRRHRPADATERRGGGLRRLPDTLARLLDREARRRGLVDARLLTDWPAIVGPALADRAQPVRLGRGEGGGVLHLRVGGSAALELQHAAPQLIERINDHFGYPAVAQLRFLHGPLVRPARPPPRPEVDPGAEALRALEQRVAAVADPALRDALARLGEAVLRRPPAEDERRGGRRGT